MAEIANGADVNEEDEEGWTPLMYAAYNNEYSDVINMLLDKGADIDAKNNDEWTPLVAAASHGFFDIIEALLKAGADVNVKDNEGKTALDYAKENKNPEILKLLEGYLTGKK